MQSPYASQLTWKEQVKALHEAHAVGEALAPKLRDLGRSQAEAIAGQTESLLAGERELAAQFQGRMEHLSNEFSLSLAEIQDSLIQLEQTISFQLETVWEQLEGIRSDLEQIDRRLAKMDFRLASPARTRAREMYRTGSRMAKVGEAARALEYFRKAESIFEADSEGQLFLGALYMYGYDPEQGLPDLDKAERHLRFAVKCATAELGFDSGASGRLTETRYQLSVACYLQAGELTRRGEDARAKLGEALGLARQVAGDAPGNPRHHFQQARCAALLRDGEETAPALRQAIILDPNCFSQAAVDPDFAPVRQKVDELLREVTDQALYYAFYLRGRLQEWQGQLAAIFGAEDTFWPSPDQGRTDYFGRWAMMLVKLTELGGKGRASYTRVRAALEVVQAGLVDLHAHHTPWLGGRLGRDAAIAVWERLAEVGLFDPGDHMVHWEWLHGEGGPSPVKYIALAAASGLGEEVLQDASLQLPLFSTQVVQKVAQTARFYVDEAAAVVNQLRGILPEDLAAWKASVNRLQGDLQSGDPSAIVLVIPRLIAIANHWARTVAGSQNIYYGRLVVERESLQKAVNRAWFPSRESKHRLAALGCEMEAALGSEPQNLVRELNSSVQGFLRR